MPRISRASPPAHLHRTPISGNIETVITHGNTGAANGLLKFAGRSLAFCSVYHFNSFKDARIKRITSYRIPVA